MDSGQNTTADETHTLPRVLPLLDKPRASVIDFGGLTPRYYAPMHFPNEVCLYEPSVESLNNPARVTASQLAIKAEVDVPLPCGRFNIWRALHDRATPVSKRLQRYFPESALGSGSDSQWDSRITYSSADDEYYENGLLLPLIKGWSRGMLHARNVFRKVEHDWGMTYLTPDNVGPNTQSLAVWRFNYLESRRTVKAFHAALGFSVFAPTAHVQWYIRPLSQQSFKAVPMYILTAEEAQCFSEIAGRKGRTSDSSALKTREDIIGGHRGEILAYIDQPDEHNAYILHSVPALATDLSEYVQGEYGFEIAAAFFPATEGENRWQKVQIARQSLSQPVGGRTSEGEDAASRCGLDFRIKLQDDVPVGTAPEKLVQALASAHIEGLAQPMIDDGTCDFAIHVNDSENVVGSLQPPIQAHERVLAAGSEYFAALLGSSMTEATAKKVELDNLPYGAVRLAINYLYTGGVPCEGSMDLADWIVLLSVSSRLSIFRLHRLCQARIFQETLSLTQSSPTADSGVDTTTPCYRELVEYPDMDSIGYLQDVASDTGAEELSSALKRLVVYYPIQVLEERVRSGPVETFAPRTATSSIRIRRHMPHMEPAQHGFPDAHLGQAFDVVEHMHMEHHFNDHDSDNEDNREEDMGLVEPDDNGPAAAHFLGVGGPAIMPGLAIHAERLEGLAWPQPAADGGAPDPAPGPAQEQHGIGGLVGRLLGNWRVVNNNNNGGDDGGDGNFVEPPSPVPGPVPEPPQMRPTAAADVDVPPAMQTTQPPHAPGTEPESEE
ncbi:protein modification by small protein conjugation or removal [Coemansia sp. RSA 2320]|nr:protein modification by small protein conjugation or removal [Coemansia sp. RSA 2320]